MATFGGSLKLKLVASLKASRWVMVNSLQFLLKVWIKVTPSTEVHMQLRAYLL